MYAVEQFEYAGCRAVAIGEHQPEYITLPALAFEDGKVLIEWTFTEEERAAIARGENIRHWIWRAPACLCGRPRPFEPVLLECTNERKG